MALTGTVTLAVLMGALLHAAWNALVKSSTDKALDTALIHLIGSLVAIPGVVLLGWPPAEAWPYILTSMLIHIGYYTSLAGAYRHGVGSERRDRRAALRSHGLLDRGLLPGQA